MDIFLDPARPRQLSAMLFEQLREAVASERLAPGDRLPTSRSLADDLAVSRSTVTTVYGRLVAEGVLVSRVGNGTFVAEHPNTASRSSDPVEVVDLTRRRPPPSRPRRGFAGLDPDTAVDLAADLRTGRPDPALFPLTAWRRSVKHAAELPPPGYGHPAGLPELRTALATWVGRSRGLNVHADQVLVTSGAQQAFDLCARVMTAPGDTVAFEEPGYAPARRAFLAHGARIEPVRVDREGIVVADIDRSARVVFVTPSHQSPTGATMSATRRHALLDLAYRSGMAVIEDDYDTEYRYVDRPLEPLHRLDTGGRVVYLGTFSKSLSPSLRLGYVVASGPVIDALVATRRLSDAQPPHLPQAALANLIVTGGLDKHLRGVRPIYRERHDLLAERIDDLHARGLIPSPWVSNAGLHTMVELHPGTDVDAVTDAMARTGVVVESTRENWHGLPHRPGLAIGFGLASADLLTAAFDNLARVLVAQDQPESSDIERVR